MAQSLLSSADTSYSTTVRLPPSSLPLGHGVLFPEKAPVCWKQRGRHTGQLGRRGGLKLTRGPAPGKRIEGSLGQKLDHVEFPPVGLLSNVKRLLLHENVGKGKNKEEEGPTIIPWCTVECTYIS
uniref:Uncharacterized protein n=1 Tax=Aegilops tauschii TaxID=37682 RepID=M8BNT7_AEGTA